MSNAVLTRLQEERQAQFDFIDQLTAAVEADGRDMVEAERQNVEAAHRRVGEIDAQIRPLEEFEALRQTHRQSSSEFRATGPQVPAGGESRGVAYTSPREYAYRSVGEFLADTWKGTVKRDERALSRLETHGVSVGEGGLLQRAAAPHNTTAEVPGLIPDVIVGDIMNNIDAARPFITSVGPKDLAGIPGLTFERPVITQHTQVAKQTAEKATLANRQFLVSGIPFTKDTYGGYANVSRQSIDWTSPAVWDALMADFIEQYGLETENAAADAFVTAVTQTTESTAATGQAPTLAQLLKALYAMATQAYNGGGRMPDTVWMSLDMWATLGELLDPQGAGPNTIQGGGQNLGSFNGGSLMNLRRVVVPSFAAGTLIVGTASRTEVYEDRIGFLTAVQPKVLGVELAYGGYMASGTVKPAAFSKYVNAV